MKNERIKAAEVGIIFISASAFSSIAWWLVLWIWTGEEDPQRWSWATTDFFVLSSGCTALAASIIFILKYIMRVSNKELEEILKAKGIKIKSRNNEAGRVGWESKSEAKNKKVRNAKKTIVDGIQMDSILEGNFYKSVKTEIEKGDCIWKPEKIVLEPAFVCSSKKKRKAITWSPDSYFPREQIYVDPKGHITAPTRLRIKLHLARGGRPVVLLKTNEEIKNFVILYRAKKISDILDLYGF